MSQQEQEKLYNRATGMSFISSHLIQNRVQQELQKRYKDINLEQVFMLMELNYEDGIRPSLLADRIHRSKGTMTSLIRHASKNELVSASPDPTHKNAKKVYLTQKGKRIHDELVEVIRRELDFVEDGIDPEHLAIYRDVAEKFVLKLRPEFFNY